MAGHRHTPPLHGSIGNPAVLCSAYLSGVDQAYAIVGIQASIAQRDAS